MEKKSKLAVIGTDHMRSCRIYYPPPQELPIMFSFGIGDDINAELQAIERYNCCVYAFDPTPNVAKWIKRNQPDHNFYFYNIALTAYDGEADFYFPENTEYISGAINKEHVGWQKLSNASSRVKCNTLSSLMRMLNVNRIDYLKLCIEGCEYEVIENILSEKVNITQIAIAFCGRTLKSNYNFDKKLYQKLANNGYKCLDYSTDSKVTFVKSDH